MTKYFPTWPADDRLANVLLGVFVPFMFFAGPKVREE